MRNSRSVAGVLTLLPTPFDASGALDLAAVERLVTWLEAEGMHGIVVASSVGEMYALDDCEYRALVETARNACRRMALVVNCAAQNTRKAIERVRYAEEVGADCALVYPYHYVEARFDADTYQRYFELLFRATSRIALMAFNDTRETKRLSISVTLYERLFADFDRLTASVEDILNVSEGGLVEIAHLFDAYRDRATMLTRSEADMFIGMALGAKGCLATYGLAMPNVLLELYERCKHGQWREALEVYRRLTRAPWEAGVVGVNLPGHECTLYPGTFTTPMGNTHVIAGQKVGTIFPGTAMICKAMSEAAGRSVGTARLPYQPAAPALQAFARRWLDDVHALGVSRSSGSTSLG
jgi:dihydrodipicolinate synthase/N-acetylneuraminate lyase